MSEEYSVEQSGAWHKLIGPDGEQVGKSQRSEEEAWALAPEPDEPEAEVEADPEPDAGVPTSKWHGLTNYHCPECSFAHLDRREVYDHVRRRHSGTNPKGGSR